MKSRATLLFIAVLTVSAVAQHPYENAANGHDHEVASAAMSTRHMESTPHMRMTPVRALQPGDEQRAGAVVEAARKALERYRDYRVAESDGYEIFLPNVPQKMYHFTNYEYGFQAAFVFDPYRPTSLLYEKSGNGYKLIGAMYTAPYQATMEELDSRVPLSMAQWHLHTNFCQAPEGRRRGYFGPHPRFGLRGSIATKQACEQAGGTFHDHVFGWMVHVYPFESDPAQVWSVERQMEHSH